MDRGAVEQARQRLRTSEAGNKIAAGKRSAGGKGPRYLFSGLMRCESCGSNFVMTNSERYACAGHTNGRICDNDRTVRRKVPERRLLAAIQSSLLTEEAVEWFKLKFADCYSSTRPTQVQNAASNCKPLSAKCPTPSPRCFIPPRW